MIYKHKDKQNLFSHNNISLEPQPPSPLKSEEDPAMINWNRLILLSFGKREDTGGEGMILGENSAGHCFVSRDLIPINFFKKVMNVKLKMQTTGKIFGKICV